MICAKAIDFGWRRDGMLKTGETKPLAGVLSKSLSVVQCPNGSAAAGMYIIIDIYRLQRKLSRYRATQNVIITAFSSPEMWPPLMDNDSTLFCLRRVRGSGMYHECAAYMLRKGFSWLAVLFFVLQALLEQLWRRITGKGVSGVCGMLMAQPLGTGDGYVLVAYPPRISRFTLLAVRTAVLALF